MKANRLINSELFFGASPDTFNKANALRKKMTQTEKSLWCELRNKKLGVKFRRQHPINIFIVDFYCHEIKLVIELDGSIHNLLSNQEYDKERSIILNDLGIKVIRFKNIEIEQDITLVLNMIKLYILNLQKQ